VRRNLFVIDNTIDGFNLYHLDDASYIRNFHTGNPIKNVAKQVAFGEDDRIIVGGSDHGVVYVFDRKSGSPLGVLQHAKDGQVQTVTVSRDEYMIDQVIDDLLADSREKWCPHHRKCILRSWRRQFHLYLDLQGTERKRQICSNCIGRLRIPLSPRHSTNYRCFRAAEHG
jgi:hypothetical protein